MHDQKSDDDDKIPPIDHGGHKQSPFDDSPKKRQTLLRRLSKLPASISHQSLPKVKQSQTVKHNESIIDSLNEQFFGLKYELDEKAKKYRNIIKEKIQKSKYHNNRGNQFLNAKGKLSLPNIGQKTDIDWNALTHVDFNQGNDEAQRQFTADTHVLMGNILEPNDIGYGEDGDEESNLEHQRTRDFNKTNEFKNWQNKNLLLNED